ncbi:MAG TPA: hypothetical protein DD638_00650 [Pasteurellaceae bacterium]|nr:hypothetical protein [Pasteurellaceae bacterium]
MTDTLVLIGILIFFLYALYDQFGMDLLKGKTKLKVRLKKQAKSDAIIFIVLICLIIYQAQSQIHTLSTFTLFLLATAIILTIYGAFIRAPVLLLKQEGFFYGNIYLGYDRIHQVNLAEGNIIVIDLKSGKRLLVFLITKEDADKVVAFFGGYKENSNKPS